MNFIDTNVIIYAFDESDPAKSKIARSLLQHALVSGSGSISTQVIGEFCNVALKLAVSPLTPGEMQSILQDLLLPLLAYKPEGSFYARVLSTYERYSLSFYDAAIVQAAIDLGCTTLYSEDMQASATYGIVTIVNPFQEPPAGKH